MVCKCFNFRQPFCRSLMLTFCGAIKIGSCRLKGKAESDPQRLFRISYPFLANFRPQKLKVIPIQSVRLKYTLALCLLRLGIEIS